MQQRKAVNHVEDEGDLAGPDDFGFLDTRSHAVARCLSDLGEV
jgi:hypothetical protein